MGPEDADRASPPRFSVVIPTYQRRDLVLALLRSLVRQQFAEDYEVVVVVDGSTDGTAEAIQSERFPFPLRLLVHANRGLARTRNRGARNSRGDVLLFLDDDMEADPHLLAEHYRSHQEGADVVVGYIPLHPESPDTLLAEGVGRWADSLRDLLAAPGHQLSWEEIFGGQMSLRRQVFEALGGFDESFTWQGSYGNEDVDFGYRLVRGGYRVVFNPQAVSRQHYDVTAATNLGQWRQVGRADVALARKHPEIGKRIFVLHQGERLPQRLLGFAVRASPGLSRLLSAPLARFVVGRLDGGRKDRLSRRLFRIVRAVEYWRGVREAGGIPRPRAVRVLCYHALSDLSGDELLEQYGTPLETFERQLDLLRRAGYSFIGPQELLDLLDGRAALPRKPLFLTFDDAYLDFAAAAVVLEARGIAAALFVVSREIGGSNAWERGGRRLGLLDAEQIRTAARQGVEVGSHGRTHRMLTAIPADQLDEEVAGSIHDLAELGLGRPRLFAYPHGEHDASAREAVRAAGLQAAFTVDPGRVIPGGDPFALPRIEILRRDQGWRLRWKVAVAGHRLDAPGRLRSLRRRLGLPPLRRRSGPRP